MHPVGLLSLHFFPTLPPAQTILCTSCRAAAWLFIALGRCMKGASFSGSFLLPSTLLRSPSLPTPPHPRLSCFWNIPRPTAGLRVAMVRGLPCRADSWGSLLELSRSHLNSLKGFWVIQESLFLSRLRPGPRILGTQLPLSL